MWPWSHAALGYLAYTLYLRYADDLPPSGPAAVTVAFATQLPDLVDKMGAWYLGVLPGGRSLAHSALIAVPVVLAVGWLALEYRRGELGAAFAVGYLSHLVGDAYAAVAEGEWAEITFLLWPALPLPDYEGTPGILAHIREAELTPRILFGFLLTGVALAVWARHGYPGVRTVRAGGRRLLGRLRDAVA